MTFEQSDIKYLDVSNICHDNESVCNYYIPIFFWFGWIGAGLYVYIIIYIYMRVSQV